MVRHILSRRLLRWLYSSGMALACGYCSLGGTSIASADDMGLSTAEETVVDDGAAVDWSCVDHVCPPWIQVRAGALALHRSSQQEHVLLSDQATGAPLLSTTDVNPDWSAGAELDVLLRLTADWDFEFDWFSLGDWSRLHTVDLTGIVTNPFASPLTSGRLESSSKLHNFEFNFRRRLTDRLSVLGGFRYLELDDHLRLHYEDSSPTPISQDAHLAERNRLYGFQLGTQATLWQAGPWAFDGWAKAGIYGNASRSDVDVTFTGVPIVLPSLRAQASDAAFVGDLGLRLTRSFGRHVSLYGGYRVMLVDGVALASNQVDSVGAFFNSGTPEMTTGGSPFYHGAELGLIFAY